MRDDSFRHGILMALREYPLIGFAFRDHQLLHEATKHEMDESLREAAQELVKLFLHENSIVSINGVAHGVAQATSTQFVRAPAGGTGIVIIRCETLCGLIGNMKMTEADDLKNHRWCDTCFPGISDGLRIVFGGDV